MTLTTDEAVYHFPPEFDERAEYEMTPKGHLCGGAVELADGRRYQVTFFDPIRIRQELEYSLQDGRPAVFLEPGLVVIPEVTRAAIRAAVAEMAQEGFFDHLRPLPAPAAGTRAAG